MQYLKREIRERILSSAVEEFKEHGFANASIRNIANNAEISLGNIYRYFANKEALYFAVINPFMESVKQSIERDFVFKDKTMKEASEVLVRFLMEYSDEIMIIRKGNSVHYETFINYIIEVIANKIREMMEESFPEIEKKIQHPDFYVAVADGFLNSLFKILRKDDSIENQERNIRELVTFYFGHMSDRFYHYELTE
ncbi:MAG: TetR/AcrR family transcriptional regulator [Clostridia bacterium]|nr:TetR/AcrR family transcriptional regulator [Clostridia bacterium]